MNDNKYAASDRAFRWEDINLHAAEAHVKKLQRRIVGAWSVDDRAKMKSLQHRMIHSLAAKALAVKYVTSNNGRYPAKK